MNWYSLYHLLIFFKRQQSIGYQGINFCVAIVDDHELTDAEKREAIIDFLRKLELYDDGYVDKRIRELEQEIKLKGVDDVVWDIPGMGPVNPTQVFDCNFLNCKVQFEWNLN